MVNNLDLVVDALRTLQPIVGGFDDVRVGYKGAQDLLSNEMTVYCKTVDDKFDVSFHVDRPNGYRVRIVNWHSLEVVETFLSRDGKCETEWQELVDITEKE